MCKCLSKVRKILAKSNTRVDMVSLVNFKTGKIRESLKIATARIDRRQRTKVRTLLPSFCPFCGEKYLKENANANKERN